ncbi:hypothetical protein ACIXN8_06060 [Bacteroides fragilis]
MVRITINGKSVEICTGQKALLANWSIRLHQCVGSCAKQTNLFLKSIRFRLNQIFYQQSLYGETTTPQKSKILLQEQTKRIIIYFLYLNYIMRV